MLSFSLDCFIFLCLGLSSISRFLLVYGVRLRSIIYYQRTIELSGTSFVLKSVFSVMIWNITLIIYQISLCTWVCFFHWPFFTLFQCFYPFLLRGVLQDVFSICRARNLFFCSVFLALLEFFFFLVWSLEYIHLHGENNWYF